nr:hypothetical protein [Tanacetum cinerariifolium]
MGEPLSLDRVFDFPKDELEPHLAYDFFAPAPLPGYAGNPNNNNGWLEADDHLLGEIEAMVDKPTIVPAIKEVAEPVAEAKEEHVITLDDDFEDDDSKGFDEEEAWEVNKEWLMAPVMPPLVPAMQPLSVYEVGGQQTATQRDETIAELTQQVQALQIDVQQRDTQIQQLQTIVTEMGSRESTLLRCILGLERRIAALEKRPLGP